MKKLEETGIENRGEDVSDETPVIWKYELKFQYSQKVPMPQGAMILCLQMQNSRPHTWAYCNPDAPRVNRLIIMEGTGLPCESEPSKYIGTVQTESFTWHFFDGGEE